MESNNNIKLNKKIERFIFRASLWKAHDMKCFFCGDILSDLLNIEVDHIIPQKYKNTPEEFEKIKIEYELQPDFDIEAYYNKVPTHNGCNKRKLDKLYSKKTTHFFIEEVRKKIPRIKKNQVKYRKELNISNKLLKGELIIEEIQKILDLDEINEKKTSKKASIDIKSIEENIKSLRKNFEFIKKHGIMEFEWRFWDIYKKIIDIKDNWEANEGNIQILINLILLMYDFIQEQDKDLLKWGIDILKLSANSSFLLKLIKKRYFENIKKFYPPKEYNQSLIDLLDKCGHFPDDTIPEIIRLFKNRENLPLRHFINNLYYKKITLLREKRQYYIDQISMSLSGLEPKTNPNHSELIQLANRIRDILNK